jgi:hypothetical protein
MNLRQAVVSVGGMAEAFLVALRSAYDAVAIALAYKASSHHGQVPANSLADLVEWAKNMKAG